MRNIAQRCWRFKSSVIWNWYIGRRKCRFVHTEHVNGRYWNNRGQKYGKCPCKLRFKYPRRSTYYGWHSWIFKNRRFNSILGHRIHRRRIWRCNFFYRSSNWHHWKWFVADFKHINSNSIHCRHWYLISFKCNICKSQRGYRYKYCRKCNHKYFNGSLHRRTRYFRVWRNHYKHSHTIGWHWYLNSFKCNIYKSQCRSWYKYCR